MPAHLAGRVTAFRASSPLCCELFGCAGIIFLQLFKYMGLFLQARAYYIRSMATAAGVVSDEK
jgi:hypothetical protein